MPPLASCTYHVHHVYMTNEELKMPVLSPSEARAKFADVQRRVLDGEDIGIGPNGVATIRVTRNLKPTEFDLPKEVFSPMLHGAAANEALVIAQERQSNPNLTYFGAGRQAGIILGWLLDHPNPWWARDYVLTLLFTLRSAEKEAGLSRTRLDDILRGLVLVVPDGTGEVRERLFGEFRDELSATIRYVEPGDADEILASTT